MKDSDCAVSSVNDWFTVEQIDAETFILNGFSRLKAMEKLRQGSGRFDFETFQIHL